MSEASPSIAILQVRSFAVDVVKSATREASRGLAETIMTACGLELFPSPGVGTVESDGDHGGEGARATSTRDAGGSSLGYYSAAGKRDGLQHSYGRGGGQPTATAISLGIMMQRICVLLSILIALLIFNATPSVI